MVGYDHDGVCYHHAAKETSTMRKNWLKCGLALLCVLCLLVPTAALAKDHGTVYESCGASGHDIMVWNGGRFGGHYEKVQSNVSHSFKSDVCIYCGYNKSTNPDKKVVNPNYTKSVALQNQAMMLGYSAIGGIATVEVGGNIRCGYSTSAAIVGKAKVGQVFNVLDCYISTYGGGATWYLIPYNNGTAWISAGLVSVVPPYGYNAGTAYGNGFVSGAYQPDYDYGTGYTQVTPVVTQAPVYPYYPVATQVPAQPYYPAATQAPAQPYYPVATQAPVQPYYPVATAVPNAGAATPVTTVGQTIMVATSGFGYTATTTLSQVVGQVLAGETYTVQDVAYDLNSQCWYCINWNNARMWIPSYLVSVY